MLENNTNNLQFQIQRIYTKDVSFESPKAPEIFQKEWNPEVKLDLNTTSSRLNTDIYEVVLHIMVIVTMEQGTVFLCEIQQAGIFTISGITETQMEHCLGAYCPNILFPYARECIATLISRGSFPQLNLEPVNFEALFMNYLNNTQHNKNEPTQDML